MKFKVIGSHKSSGDRVEMVVEADDAVEAQHRAADMGMAVSRVLPKGLVLPVEPLALAVMAILLVVLSAGGLLWYAAPNVAPAPAPPAPAQAPAPGGIIYYAHPKAPPDERPARPAPRRPAPPVAPPTVEGPQERSSRQGEVIGL